MISVYVRIDVGRNPITVGFARAVDCRMIRVFGDGVRVVAKGGGRNQSRDLVGRVEVWRPARF